MPKTKRPSEVPRNADDKAQSERFIETAREHGADDEGEKFKRAFKEVVPPRRRPKSAR
jgi:hypothetical protein